MKKSYLFLSLALSVLPLAGSAATVTLKNGDISYTESTPWGDIAIDFARCMANKLYTFSSVSLDGKELNHTDSDNIGPFLIDKKGWAGGNHTNDGRLSAETVDVSISVDGNILACDTTVTGKVLTVEVVNNLRHPVDDSPLDIERMVYIVSGNSIEVFASHRFLNDEPETIERYYGMQSMFIKETETLAPGTQFGIWTSYPVTNTGNEIKVVKSTAPAFSTFVEHSANGYQASHMTRDGIGDRSWVADDDIVFIGNSWSKSYHKTIGMHPVKAGDSFGWHGIYTWFREPVSDRSRRGDEACPTFDYGAYIAGEPYIFHLAPDGSMTPIPLKAVK